MEIRSIKPYMTPALSLCCGFVALFLFRRGIGFAPFSFGIAVVAWISAVLFSRFFSKHDLEETPLEEKKSRRIWRWISRSAVVGMYQNVLFFLLPVWFGSAELLSVNVIFPLMLSALALFACFDDHFTRWVLKRETPRTMASALLLFSVSVPALSLLNFIPLRMGVGICAAIATLAAMLLGLRKTRHWARVGLGLSASVVLGFLLYVLSPFLPPVPVQCVSMAAASRIENRRPIDIKKVFPAKTPKIHVHFAVAAPERFKQKIRFQWFVNGKKRGKPIPSSIVGGRKKGFRTWTYITKPHTGAYRVDLETGEGQLIGRGRFLVR